MKIVKPKARADGRKTVRQSWLADWRENRLAHYILLSCDHYTERESVRFFSAWQPRRGIYWCEVHKDWYRPAQIQRPILPELPDF